MIQARKAVACPGIVGAALALLALAPGSAMAARAVVVVPFSGPQRGAATSAVRRALSGSYRVVSASAFAAAARRGGLRAGSSSGRVAAARALKVSAIITGSIHRVAGRWVLRVEVFSGHSGRSVGRASFPLRGVRVDPTTARRIGSVLPRHIAKTRAPPGAVRARVHRRARPRPRPRLAARPPVAVPPRPVSPQVDEPPDDRSGFDDGGDLDNRSIDDGALVDDPAPTVAPPRPVTEAAAQPARVADDLGFEVAGGRSDAARAERRVAMDTGSTLRQREREAEDVLDDSDERAERGIGRRPPWESIVEVSAGLMLVSRSFAFHEPVDPERVPDYKTPGVVPAIHVEAAVYPLAAIARGVLANVGLAARYYRVVALKSKVEGKQVQTDTLLQEFEVGLRYRWNILGRITSPTLRAGLDYGRQMFFILGDLDDPKDTTDTKLPNISYTYLKLALVGFEMPFYHGPSITLGILASFDYLVVFSAGDIERADMGGWGRSTTGGIDFGGGIFASYRGFFARATGFYRRMFYAFDGTCRRPQCNYAGGALDIYAGATINVGYAY